LSAERPTIESAFATAQLSADDAALYTTVCATEFSTQCAALYATEFSADWAAIFSAKRSTN